MGEKIKKYESENISVIWNPENCIHSEKCWRGLGNVFNPKERPWINVDREEDALIVKQIDQCPSGALSYQHKKEEITIQDKETQIVEVSKNGPLMVFGSLRIKHIDGSESAEERVTAFCRCGASGNKPFCDGSHKTIDFKG